MNPLNNQPQNAASPFTNTASVPSPFTATQPSTPQMTPLPKTLPSGDIGMGTSNPDTSTDLTQNQVLSNLAAAGYQVPSKINPQTFQVPTTGSIDSTSLGKTSPGALQDALDAKQLALRNGTNPNSIPSDGYYQQSLQQNLYNDVGAYSKYSPEEQQLLQQKSNNDAKIYNTQLAERRQIKQLQEDGQMTKEQAAAFISESQRRADAQNADQAGLGMFYNSSLDVLGKIRGNQLTAAQTQYGMLQPTQVAPGSSLYNPITGVQYQGTGASPQGIFQASQTLKTNDQMTGNLHLTPQGTVDDNYYYQQAQAQLSGGRGTPNGQVSNNTGGNNSQIPQQVQTYLKASGGQYVNADKVPTNQQDLVKQLSAENGVPYLETGQVQKIQSIDVTNDNLTQLNGVASRILGSGLTGKTIGATWNIISSVLQLNPEISSFNAFRDTAINTIQALAGGAGSGLKINQGEINTAVGNLPKITDNLETAQKKIELVQGFMNKWKSEILTGTPGVTPPPDSKSGSKVIQTKVGAVDNSWFN